MVKKVSKYKKVVPANKYIPQGLFNKIQKSVPIVCVDIVFLRRSNDGAEILLFKRAIFPEQGKWCVPGGRMLKGETIQRVINRQAERELGVKVKILSPFTSNNPAGVFSDPVTDVRKHFVSLAYPVLITGGQPRKSGPEFSEFRWFSINKLPPRLGFNHLEEIKYVIKAVKKNGKI